MKSPKRISVLIDTNLWISFLIGKKLQHLKMHIINNDIDLIYSDQLILEIDLVTKRTSLKKYFLKDDVEDLLGFIKQIGFYTKITSKVSRCRDEKDDFLLALSQDSNATYLVTGDKDLLSLKLHKHTKIINYKEFESLL